MLLAQTCRPQGTLAPRWQRRAPVRAIDPTSPPEVPRTRGDDAQLMIVGALTTGDPATTFCERTDEGGPAMLRRSYPHLGARDYRLIDVTRISSPP
jgi:hypothetical protein